MNINNFEIVQNNHLDCIPKVEPPEYVIDWYKRLIAVDYNATVSLFKDKKHEGKYGVLAIWEMGPGFLENEGITSEQHETYAKRVKAFVDDKVLNGYKNSLFSSTIRCNEEAWDKGVEYILWIPAHQKYLESKNYVHGMSVINAIEKIVYLAPVTGLAWEETCNGISDMLQDVISTGISLSVAWFEKGHSLPDGNIDKFLWENIGQDLFCGLIRPFTPQFSSIALSHITPALISDKTSMMFSGLKNRLSWASEQSSRAREITDYMWDEIQQLEERFIFACIKDGDA